MISTALQIMCDLCSTYKQFGALYSMKASTVKIAKSDYKTKKNHNNQMCTLM